MLEINVPANTLWNAEKEEFVNVKAAKLQLEHSLISLSKWEAKYERPFLKVYEKDKNGPNTMEELLDYIKFMTLTNNVDPNVYLCLTNENLKDIQDYIGKKMTATTFTDNDPNKTKNGDIMTSEVIYYYMAAAQIPFSCEKWHLNRLLTLLHVASIKSNPDSKKMPKRDVSAYYAKLNRERRAKFHSKG